MSNFRIAYNPQLFWLGHFLTDAQMDDITEAEMHPKHHHNFIYPYMNKCSHQFVPIYTVEEQAICQVLSHKGCIPATLLFGYSLATEYELSARVVCAEKSFEYLFIGVAALLCYHKDNGFLQELQFVYGNRLLYMMCRYLLKQQDIFGFDDHSHPVIQFCHDMVFNIDNDVRLDS